jgi:hypothetical protein
MSILSFGTLLVLASLQYCKSYHLFYRLYRRDLYRRDLISRIPSTGSAGGTSSIVVRPFLTHRANECDHDTNSEGSVPSLKDRRKVKRQQVFEADLQLARLKAETSGRELLGRPSNEEAAAYQLPSDAPTDSQIEGTHIKFYSFDELFPHSGLGEKFDRSSKLRADIRAAAREDFFVSDATLSEEANNALKDPRSTLMSNWRKPNEYAHLTEVFSRHEIALTGPVFIRALTDLCGSSPHVFGSWIDIIGVRGRAVAHSWHQDSGLEQRTVMVGFPPSDHYDGTGVFSHAFKLSHRLPTPANAKEPRLWSGPAVEEPYIVRPAYGRGREVMVYDDRDIFHSAPDFANRESIWRFM